MKQLVLCWLVMVLVGCTQDPANPPIAFGCGCPDQSPPTPTNAHTIGARLKPYRMVASDGLVQPIANKYYDTELGVSCAFVRHADGAPLSCLPDTSPWAYDNYYSDSACTQRISFVDDCATMPLYVRMAKQDACNQSITAYYVVGEVLTEDQVYWLTPNGCMPQNKPGGANNIAVRIEGPLDWSNFVVGTEEVVLE